MAITAHTSCAWYITSSVGSTICVSAEMVGIQCSLYFSSVGPSITASTPGILSAFEVSIFLILACAYGLRTMSMYSIPGSLMSST